MSQSRLVVLISGRGSNLQALIDAFHRPGSPVSLVAVIANRERAGGLAKAKVAGIPTRVVRHRDYPDRERFDLALMHAIDDFSPDLLALAGFMRILTPAFVQHYNGRMLNIHPSLLPRYRGLDTHRRAIEAGDRQHGATVHFVTPELDGGPSILQAAVPILPGDTPESLAERVQKQEHRIYPRAVEWFGRGRLRLRDGKACLDGEILTAPRVLSPIEPEQAQ